VVLLQWMRIARFALIALIAQHFIARRIEPTPCDRSRHWLGRTDASRLHEISAYWQMCPLLWLPPIARKIDREVRGCGRELCHAGPV